MPILVLLRHSKSDRPIGVADFERPLSERGHADAAAAGHWLQRSGHVPDYVLCSAARRARQTWRGAATPAGGEPEVHYDKRVYEADVADLLAVLADVPAEARTVVLVGHNPSMEMLSELLDPDGGPPDGLHTSGIAVHTVTTWDGLGAGTAPLTAHHTARA